MITTYDFIVQPNDNIPKSGYLIIKFPDEISIINNPICFLN